MKTATKEVSTALLETKTVRYDDQAPSDSLQTSHEISSNRLVNKLNYANFQNGTILVYFKHRRYNRSIFLHASPKPCIDSRLDCVWVDTPQDLQKLESYTFQHFLLIDHQETFLVEPEVLRIAENGISFCLPEICRDVSFREVERHSCESISAQLIQNSALFNGALIDFSAVSFRVNLTAVPPQRFQWINPDLPVNVILSKDNETLYAGECKIVRQNHNQIIGTFVIKPINQEIPRFKSKTFRSLRHEVTPPPSMVLRHPLTQRTLNLSVIDLSGSGFSVIEALDRSTLLPGMIIPELELRFANSFKATCKAQVIYRRRRVDEANAEEVRCGLAFLDMDVQDHVRLVGLLHQLKDSRSYICNAIDLDKLWHFFFETDFIYPEKYAFIQKNKEKIRETYRKLYTENPSIARYFIYQDKGEILGHMAMLRFYENAWLIHHHAASHTASNRAGLVVLDQIGRFSNDSQNLYSMHMDYLMCYFRPENKFPSRVFGGAARNINDPDVCSLDPFAYLHFSSKELGQNRLANTWSLMETSPDDLSELESFYETESGGLLMHSLDLSAWMTGGDELTEEYHRLGFIKQKHLFSLKRKNRLKAVFLVNISDIGLNLSELTSCISVIILDQDRFPLDILYTALAHLLDICGQESMPVLLFPPSYADNHSLSYEKIYNLWILNTQYGDQYFNYINRLLRFIRE